MARPSTKPKSAGKRLTTLLKSLSRRKGKTVVEQGDNMSLLLLPDNVLEVVLLQAHPLAALALGATCKHLHTELARHHQDICRKFLLQPENQVQITTHGKIKSRSFVPKTPTLGTYATQGSFTYQLVVRNHWSVRGAEVLLHMLLTKQLDPDEVWTALLPAPAQEMKMYSDCVQNCVGSAGMDINRIWDVHIAIRFPVKLSQAEFDALVPGCQPFIQRVRELLADVTSKSVEDMHTCILFQSVNWYRVFRSTQP